MALAQAVFELAPSLIRMTLLDDSSFRKEYGFSSDATLSFGDSGLTFQRSSLFNAIREVFSGESSKEIADTVGQKWELKSDNSVGDLPKLVVSHDDKRFSLPEFFALSPDRSTRLLSLENSVSDVNLPSAARDKWQSVLVKRALEDDELDAYYNEFRDTPVGCARSIHGDIVKGESNTDSLIPNSSRYFERLVGRCDGSTSIQDYAKETCRSFFEQLSAWNSYDGFLCGLYLSSHSMFTVEINVEHLGDADLIRAYDFLTKHGDRLSQLGAIEVGFRILPLRPDIEPFLIRLIEQIRDDDVNEPNSGFKLLSALFVLVDGELSKTRLLIAEPPFYRRLAALSQASLIQRQIAMIGIDNKSFCEWAINNRGEQFYMQTLADMRLEPRWDPEFVEASQIKAEFFGRIMIAAKEYEDNIKNSILNDLIFNNKTDSLSALVEYPCPYLPGPLEGAEDSPNNLPSEISEVIEKQLVGNEVGPTSFIALVNSALVFRIDDEQAELAAKTLKLARHRLPKLESRAQLSAILNGLATVAAITRNLALADELRVLVRTYMHDSEYILPLEEVIKIALVAAASRADLDDWKEFVGDWLTELAFSNLTNDDGERLYSHLQCLFITVPELWITCGRAEAALTAYINK
jgi:hypothetical protein